MSVRLETAGRVATVTLDRPPLNVLDLATIAELEHTIDALAARGDAHVAVVRGAGARAFCAGVAIEDHTPDKIDALLDDFHRVLARIETLDAVTIAAVHGHCLGGGMELAAACDLIIAADGSARFGQPEIALGCFPPYSAARFPRRLGAGRAADLILTGRVLDAAEAERFGFVARTGPELDDVLAGLLDQLLAHSGAALRVAKRALAAGRALAPEPALRESERLYREELGATDDLVEGVTAFLDKRPPRWRHR